MVNSDSPPIIQVHPPTSQISCRIVILIEITPVHTESYVCGRSSTPTSLMKHQIWKEKNLTKIWFIFSIADKCSHIFIHFLFVLLKNISVHYLFYKIYHYKNWQKKCSIMDTTQGSTWCPEGITS